MYYVGTLGDVEAGRIYTPAELQSINDATMAGLEAGPQGTESREAAPPATTNADTPDGFELWEPGARKSDYVYQSNNWGLNLSKCNTNTGCGLVDQWAANITEQVTGRTSTRWNIVKNANRVKGSTPTSFSYEYYCGVDRNNTGDTLCAGGGADNSASGAMNPGDGTNKNFGSSVSNRVYPMIRITALYSTPGGGQTVVSAPFRGWDVCNNNTGTTKLCATATY